MNRCNSNVCTGFTAALILALPPPTLAADLVPLYSFEGNANDTSGHGHHGVQTGVTYVPGIDGQAAWFDGNDFIEVTDHAELDFGTDDFSIAFWMIVDSDNVVGEGPHVMIEKCSGVCASEHMTLALLGGDPPGPSEGVWRLHTYGFWSSSDIVFETGVYRHVVWTRSGNTFTWYIDGEMVTQWEDPTADLSALGINMLIGRRNTDGGQDIWFRGALDDLRIYQGAISPAEIVALISPYICKSDINTDGSVTIVDLLDLLTNWGPCAGVCPQDIIPNGAVDISDLLELLTNWGTCP